jgi:hypothetical protein
MNKVIKRVSVALVLILSACAMLVGVALASPKTDKVTFCHATNAVKNPYVVITTDEDSIFKQGHDGHNGPVFNSNMTNKDTWGDIIPAFTYTTEDKKTKVVTVHTYPGKNLAGGSAILANGCNLPVVPSPSPSVSVSPSASPSASPSVSASPSMSASPSVSPSVTPSVSPTASVSASPTATGSPTGTPSVTPSTPSTGKPSVKPTPTKTAVVVPLTHKPKPPTMKPSVRPSVKPPVTSPPSELPYTGANHTVEILALGMMLVGMGVLCYTVPEALTGKR